MVKIEKSVKLRACFQLNSSSGKIRMPDDRQVTYLSKKEVEQFFQTIPKNRIRDRLLFDLVYRYGLRRREVTLIQRKHIQDSRIWIERLKGGVSGEYPLHPTTQNLLTHFYNIEKNDDNPFLITTRQSRKNQHISHATVYERFRTYAQQAQLPQSKQHVHILRHSIAVHLMNAGWEAADVQDWLGHKSITSTMIYAKISNKRREENYARITHSEEIANTNW